VKRRLAWFLVGALTFWLAAAAWSYLMWGAAAFPDCTVAAILCLLPSLGTLAWSNWSLSRAPEQQLATALGGTGIRMLFVVGGGLLLTTKVPYFTERQQSFWLYVLVFYLFDLALEMATLVAGRPAADRQQ
jgi:hypothetical protein